MRGVLVELPTDQREAMAACYRQQEQRLIGFLKLRLGSEADARDAAQETFLRLWKHVGRLESDNLTALIFVTASRVAIDKLRKTTRARKAGEIAAFDGDGADAVSDTQAGPERICLARSDVALVRRVLQELPQKCRHAFVRYRFDELSYEEIALEMGVTESMVRKYVIKAVAYCATRFDQLDGWE